jgi:hypothetical protein
MAPGSTLSADQWELLSQEIEKESSTMLHGLEKLEVLERRVKRKVAWYPRSRRLSSMRAGFGASAN